MIITFMYELTFYDQHQRQMIFKTQLIKVFNTVWLTYFYSTIYSYYMQLLADYCQQYYWEKMEYDTEFQ